MYIIFQSYSLKINIFHTNYIILIFINTSEKTFHLSKITERYLEDIEKIEAKRQERYAAFREAKLQEELSRPADINLYDIAKADMDSQSKKLE